MSNSKICTIPNCGKNHMARGWCSTHWQRWKRYGNPETVLMKISPHGTVQAYVREVAAKCTDTDCLTWPFATLRDGRGRTVYQGKGMQAHRAVCIEAHGQPPTPKHEAAHSCGKGHKGCVNGSHLKWKTKLENEADKIIHGTLLTGETHNMVKLTEDQAMEIWLAGKGANTRALANRYGVSIQAIYDIRRGRTWKWLRGKQISQSPQ